MVTSPRAGKFRHPITVQRATKTRDAAGGEVLTWATHASLRAEYVPGAGTEGASADGGELRKGTLSATFRVRYSATAAALGTEDRISYSGSTWDIQSIAEEANVFRTLAITATRRAE